MYYLSLSIILFPFIYYRTSSLTCIIKYRITLCYFFYPRVSLYSGSNILCSILSYFASSFCWFMYSAITVYVFYDGKSIEGTSNCELWRKALSASFVFRVESDTTTDSQMRGFLWRRISCLSESMFCIFLCHSKYGYWKIVFLHLSVSYLYVHSSIYLVSSCL